MTPNPAHSLDALMGGSLQSARHLHGASDVRRWAVRVRNVVLFAAILILGSPRAVWASPSPGLPESADQSEYSRIVLKGEHQIWKTENPLPTYFIGASARVLLDLTDYRLVHNGTLVTPNAVSLAFARHSCERDQRYVEDPREFRLSRTSATNVYVLDSETLGPAPGWQHSGGRPLFPGFHSGDSMLLVIGLVTEDDAGRKSFSALWVAKLFVGSPNESLQATAATRPS